MGNSMCTNFSMDVLHQLHEFSPAKCLSLPIARPRDTSPKVQHDAYENLTQYFVKEDDRGQESHNAKVWG